MKANNTKISSSFVRFVSFVDKTGSLSLAFIYVLCSLLYATASAKIW